MDGALIRRAVGGFEDRLQKVIGLFQFIPEQEIILAKFEGLQIHLGHGAGPAQIQPSEHPAAPGAFLMRYAPVIECGRKRVIDGRHDIAIQGDIINTHLSDRILSHAVGWICAEAVLEGRDMLIRQGRCRAFEHRRC